MHPAGEVTAVGINEGDGHRFSPVLRQDLNEFFRAQGITYPDARNLNNAKPGDTGGLVGFSAVNRQYASRFYPLGRAAVVILKTLRTRAQRGGVVDEGMRSQIVQRLRVAESRQIIRAGAVNHREFPKRAGDKPGVL